MDSSKKEIRKHKCEGNIYRYGFKMPPKENPNPHSIYNKEKQYLY